MTTAVAPVQSSDDLPTLFGHPTGLFNLFFAEMWERFSYYGMRALLLFYMGKALFLSYNDNRAYAVYGSYTALVYMTPFFGGMLADRVLGARLAVVIGGILMALGHLVMTWEHQLAFYLALTLLILGNGFFKPNISAIVGTLYPKGSHRRDGGFTIFYMGVNLGAAMSPLLCGYIGEKYGWHYGFGLATIGMMVGLAVFVMPNRITQSLIAIGAAAAAFALVYFHTANFWAIAVNIFVAGCLLASGAASIIALSRGGLPADAGRHPSGPVPPKHIISVLLGVLVLIPVVALFVSGFSIVTTDHEPVAVISSETIEFLKTGGDGAAEMGSVERSLREIGAVFLEEVSRPAGLMLAVCGLLSFGYLIWRTIELDVVARHRMTVVLTLTFFSMLFWAFFEQAGSSLNNFADRNVDRVTESSTITETQVGQVINLQPTQEQLGYTNGGKMFTLDQLTAIRASKEFKETDDFTIEWTVDSQNVGMGVARLNDELPASVLQSVNPICILVFGLIFSFVWTVLGSRGLEPSTAVKFALGLIQVGLGFGVIAYGASISDARGMSNIGWLILGYALHTTGELCLSPVGLSMITKLSPKVLVSTVMGAWFLATAFSQYLAAIISQFTRVKGSDAAGAEGIPTPLETIGGFQMVFEKIGWAGIACGLFCLALAPILTRWTHPEAPEGD